METKRLFIAINFPPDIKASMVTCIENLKIKAVRGNFTREENLHLTLAFIGESDRFADAAKIMEEIAAQPILLSFGKVGKFAHNRGDLYWLGTQHSSVLFALQSALTKKLIAAGFEIEARPFRPHITLGREVVAQNINIEVPEMSFMVNHIELMQSCRENGKLCYLTLYQKELTLNKP